ncbi:YjbE family integral membrane protein [Rhizobium subbaraonis]|uniref:YjbE family integral membrane protein n=1 Tax=Rhizobium subbaraonis TaxID=908946 RepID=A0A285UZ27_9HYPH|nr:TerC family protein [Rhizobium subbaraonis]SOC47144.1 YjbE family integral membrane protein [Rhizobium subbaraonis]
MEIFTSAGLLALLQVIVIDLVLAGDNAVVIGLAAAGLPAAQRKKAIFVGIIAATVLRIGLASVTVQLLDIIGLLLAGGILLLWVCWKMWRELRAAVSDGQHTAADTVSVPKKSFTQAATQIVVADVSMSLDNVLAVAGASREHPTVLVIGLALSIAMMGIAANYIARLLNRHHWIAYVGLALILYVALHMIYRGAAEVWPHVVASL